VLNVKSVKIGKTTTGQPGRPAPLWEKGESGALQSIQARLGRAGNGRAILGSGDDAAVWRPAAGQDLVVSQDALVEGQDWIDGWLTPIELGYRALAVAVSDLAAMGATPLYCLATVCVPAETTAGFMDGLLEGLLAAADAFGCQLLGGDLSSIDGPTVIDISVTGSCPEGSAMRRDKGRREDLLVVTGALGGAAAGLRDLQSPDGQDNARWRERWAQPTPRIKEGVALRERGVVCAGDISDGLLADAARTAEASGCGAEIWIDRLPVDAQIQDAFPDWLSVATASGEDFELLFSIAPGRKDALLHDWPVDLASLHVVGRLTGSTGVSLLETPGGRAVEPPAITSGHFRA
jgi:thiamine-monophosphate kinase